MALIRRTPARTELAEPAFGRGALSWPEWWPDWFSAWEPFRSLAESSEMHVEEFVEDGHLVIRAELPGIDPDRDIEITVSGGRLHIRAERRRETKVEEPHYYRAEIRYGSFSRTLPLPEGASEEDVGATFKDGVLTVRVPVDEEKAEAKKVQISRA